MKPLLSFIILLFFVTALHSQKNNSALEFYAADHPYFQYTGRIDFSNQKLPRYWFPGVYVMARFRGSECSIIVQDEMLAGTKQNYLEIIIDDTILYRVQTKGKTDTIHAVRGLPNKQHSIIVCKNTETNIGYIEFAGIICDQLLPPPPKPKRRLEFIGNSITCGAGSDLSKMPCNKGKWEDQHNAYLSYGPTTARALKAQWHLTSYSGIGLTKSCCNIPFTMPKVFDKIMQSKDSIAWDFSSYQPDAVTVCLGQNDGLQDSASFCSAYIDFINQLRSYYPKASIILLNSPMAEDQLNEVLKNYIRSIVKFLNESNEKKTYAFFFSKRYHRGCADHPDLQEHKKIAEELTAYLKSVLRW